MQQETITFTTPLRRCSLPVVDRLHSITDVQSREDHKWRARARATIKCTCENFNSTGAEAFQTRFADADVEISIYYYDGEWLADSVRLQ